MQASALLDSGAALRKFLAICEAQGGFRAPVLAPQMQPVLASQSGVIKSIDNRRLAKIAKLAGAPSSQSAGIDCRVRIGDAVRAGEPLFQVHAQTPGELHYALEYAASQPDVFTIGTGT